METRQQPHNQNTKQKNSLYFWGKIPLIFNLHKDSARDMLSKLFSVNIPLSYYKLFVVPAALEAEKNYAFSLFAGETINSGNIISHFIKNENKQLESSKALLMKRTNQKQDANVIFLPTNEFVAARSIIAGTELVVYDEACQTTAKPGQLKDKIADFNKQESHLRASLYCGLDSGQLVICFDERSKPNEKLNKPLFRRYQPSKKTERHKINLTPTTRSNFSNDSFEFISMQQFTKNKNFSSSQQNETVPIGNIKTEEKIKAEVKIKTERKVYSSSWTPTQFNNKRPFAEPSSPEHLLERKVRKF